jgi:hypothetical protein
LDPALPSLADDTILEFPTERQLAEAFGISKDELNAERYSMVYPLSYKLLMSEQKADSDLIERAKTKNNVILRTFYGGGKSRQLLCEPGTECILVPRSLQKRVVEWYHEILCHPGATRTELTIGQHLTWTGMRKTVEEICSRCPTCQLTKTAKLKYGKLPPKEPEVEPWRTLCVDMIGPYEIPRPKKKSLTFWAVTMIDPSTSWFEITAVDTKRADYVANVVEQTWLTRYPWPSEVVLDRGREFMGEFTQMMRDDYGVKRKPITTRNPQANAIIERVHKTIGEMIRTFSLSEAELDEKDPWSGMLAAIAFAV